MFGLCVSANKSWFAGVTRRIGTSEMNQGTIVSALSALVLCVSQQAFGQCNAPARTTDFDRTQLVEAAYGQEPTVTAEFLAGVGCGTEMLVSLNRIGARIRYSNPQVEYVLVTLPQSKVLEAVDLPGIDYVTIPGTYKDADRIEPIERKVSPMPGIEVPFPRVATSLPEDGPYFAASEAGLMDLWKRHPEADGRGVRVAVVDAGIDLLHPALQKGRDKDGRLVPKVADIDVVPNSDESENWVLFGHPIQTVHGTLTAGGRAWTAPGEEMYRFGIYQRKVVLGPKGNSHTKSVSIGVGVLWSEKRRRVWVDTNGDGSFKDETALADYAESHDVGFFGRDIGGDDNRIPFGVKIDRKGSAVYVAVTNGGHGTFVAGPLAANRLTGGLFDGAAPNAQLVDVVFGGTKMESMLRAMSRPDVDVVNRSGGVARYNDNGKEEFSRRVLERAVQVYNKPFVAYSAGADLFLVTDYVSGEMLRRNRQASPPYLEALNSFVWLLETPIFLSSAMKCMNI